MKLGLLLVSGVVAWATIAGAQSEDIFRQIYLSESNAVIRLVEHDPDFVNAREQSTQRTPLIVAADAGKLSLVAYLVSKGSDLNARDVNGHSAVRWAALMGHPDIVEFLLAKGAKPEIFSAVVVGDTNTVAKILAENPQWADPPVRDAPKPLQLASRYDHLDVMRLLLAQGTPPTPRDPKGQPLLLEVIGRNNLAQTRLLLEHAADVNTRNAKEETALHVAAEKGSLELLNLLLEKGADAAAKDWRGGSPLHAAVLGNQVKNVQRLLEAKADPDATSSEGRPLHIAIWKHGNVAIVRLLIAHGADLYALDNRQKSPLRLAREYRRDEIVQLLQAQGVVR